MKHCPQCSTGYPDTLAACPTHGVPLNEIRDLKPGMVVHHSYRIVRKLGQGGMGAVYLAQHTLMDEPRALKFLSAELSQDAAFTARFLREVRTLRQIRHPNVVDCGDLESAEDGSLFFSMEFVDGPDLRGFLRMKGTGFSPYIEAQNGAGPLGPEGGGSTEGGGGFNPRINQPALERALAPEERSLKGTVFSPYIETPNKDGVLTPEGALPVPLALDLTRQIAAGLAAAHARGMVHRDIKPENILLARDPSGWQPKIADFGIVATKEASTAFTRTGGTLLTVAYAAPEQWRGTPAAQLDGRTDLYALGGLLYEMLTGRSPFHAESYEGWAQAHQTTPPPPPSALRPELANWQGLDALVQRLLAKNREDRPKDVAELLSMIDAVRYFAPGMRRKTVQEANNLFVNRDLLNKRPKRTIHSVKWGIIAFIVLMAVFVVWAIATQKRSKPDDAMVQTPPAVQQQSDTNGENIPVPKGLTPNPPVKVPKGLKLDDPAEEEQKAEALYKQKHYIDARNLFEMACNDGQMKACSYLGYLYAKGIGGSFNHQKAREVYEKACDKGILSSCASLGSLYQDAGKNEEASKYFQKACNGGVTEACDLLHGVQ